MKFTAEMLFCKLKLCSIEMNNVSYKHSWCFNSLNTFTLTQLTLPTVNAKYTDKGHRNGIPAAIKSSGTLMLQSCRKLILWISISLA